MSLRRAPVGRYQIAVAICCAIGSGWCFQAQAGPCTAAIARAQAKVDAQLNAWAGAGPAGRESVAAMQHRQPTPGSLARADARLGDSSDGVRAVAELKRARHADQADDAVACEQALAKTRRLLGRGR
jgi:hypothetical protein